MAKDCPAIARIKLVLDHLCAECRQPGEGMGRSTLPTSPPPPLMAHNR